MSLALPLQIYRTLVKKFTTTIRINDDTRATAAPSFIVFSGVASEKINIAIIRVL